MPYTVGTIVNNGGGASDTQVDSPNFTAVAGDALIAIVNGLYDSACLRSPTSLAATTVGRRSSRVTTSTTR
jgi:hypothetical protein